MLVWSPRLRALCNCLMVDLFFRSNDSHSGDHALGSRRKGRLEAERGSDSTPNFSAVSRNSDERCSYSSSMVSWGGICDVEEDVVMILSSHHV